MAVEGRDLDFVIAGEQLAHHFGACEDHSHAAVQMRQFLMQAAAMNDANRIVEIENAGRFGGRNLADAVSEHHRGRQPEFAQRRRGGALDCEDERLGDAGELQPFDQIVREQSILERPSRQGPETIVDFAEGAREKCVEAIGRAAHSGPLAAIARINEGRRGAAIDRRSHDQAGNIVLLVGKALQGRNDVVGCARGHSKAIGQQIPAMSRRGGDDLQFMG